MAALRERYSVNHPDVRKMQRAIDSTQTALNNALKTMNTSKRIADMAKADNPGLHSAADTAQGNRG